MSLAAATRTRLALAAVCAIAAAATPAGAAAAESHYDATTADGAVVFFTTADQLVNGDADNRSDVFERSFDTGVGDYVTRLVSTGPIGGNQAHDAFFSAAAGDGSKAFFRTVERLVPQDDDQAFDIYVRDLELNTTALVSRAAAACSGSCGNGEVGASFGGLAANGDRVFFATNESLSEADADSVSDIYMRDVAAGSTVLVSQADASCTVGGCGNGALPTSFEDASTDGTRVTLTSAEGLVAGDTDEEIDLFRRDTTLGETALVSLPGSCPVGQACTPGNHGISSDGSHVFFETAEQVEAGVDTDERMDVYDWSGGVATLASIGPDGGNGTSHVTYKGNSRDGESVFFSSDEQLVQPDDADSALDIYERREGSSTHLVSTGPLSGDENPATMEPHAIAGEGSGLRVFFTTVGQMVAGDTDDDFDVYERSGGETTLVSRGSSSCEPGCGNGDYDAAFDEASDDGDHVLFVTTEQLAAADVDSVQDIYERTAGATSLVSVGPVGGSGQPSERVGIAGDGSRVFFETRDELTVDDDDSDQDVYSHSETGTRLESVGNDPSLEIGPQAPALTGTDPASPGQSTTPRIVGQAGFGTVVKIYRSADCSGEQALDPSGEPAGGTGAELAEPGIQVAVAAGSTATFYATAEAEGIVSDCSNGRTYVQQAQQGETPPPPPPPPPPTGGSGGSDDDGDGGKKSKDGGKPQFHSGGIAFVAPKTLITFGPAFKTRRRRVVFKFYDATGQPGTSFICKLDRRRWRRCSSPARLKRLRRGRHVFRVKAVNAAGTWERNQVKRRFKVVRR